MQNFSYIIAPFTDAEGKPLSGARVTFRELGTSGEKIDIYDFSGTTRIENPLILNSDGRLPKTPYIKDGVSYKVTIEKPTGIEPIYDGALCLNESECWEDPVVYNVASVNNEQDVDISNVYVEGVAGVRNAPKALGSVIANGYADANDGCPSRVYTWVEAVELPEDNGFTVLLNPDDNSGYWSLDFQGGVADVRMGGLFPSNGNFDNSIVLARIASALSSYGVATIYFPAGNYYLGSNHTIRSAIVDNNAYFYPYGSTNVVLAIARLENRGGKFCTNTTSNAVCIPNVNGVLRTSWLSGGLKRFISKYDNISVGYTGIFDNVTCVYFDNASDDLTTWGYEGTIARVKAPAVIQYGNVAAFSNKYFKAVVDLSNEQVYFNGSIVTKDSKIVPNDDGFSVWYKSAEIIKMVRGQNETLTVNAKVFGINIQLGSSDTGDGSTAFLERDYITMVDGNGNQTNIYGGSIKTGTIDAEVNASAFKMVDVTDVEAGSCILDNYTEYQKCRFGSIVAVYSYDVNSKNLKFIKDDGLAVTFTLETKKVQLFMCMGTVIAGSSRWIAWRMC